ncbi:Cytochrome c biogenesis protein, transmembrane region (plasmid) [Cupriavidus taiwanensis]|uniref:Cytochrome c biogenesis protein, transmembrane region n=1 Tax=Cupriavidus taiwanensis TaxID=164546 RepID=A0A375IPU6_9BURK|nr:cytochrome c biogenesis protein DipZ [Cupriavidus taiwanensis]SPK76090.1 Cytochrome c biogenesis protein, transmembrane region [Cupriavidus taiwanensis]
MTLLILAYLGGALTLLSPCILPVLPFVLSRSGQPFLRGRLPMLAGMVLTFAAVATLASVGGAWAVRANEYGRYGALALLVVFGLSLLVPKLADTLTRPVVALGNRLVIDGRSAAGASPWASLLLGVATGMLWAPCAGPILGIVLTTAALQGASVQGSLLLVAYATGAATSLAVALGIGGRVFAAMKHSMGAGEWLRRGLGVGVLGGVAAVAIGADVGLLARLPAGGPAQLEQALIARLHKPVPPMRAANDAQPAEAPMLLAAADTGGGFPSRLPVEGRLPSLDGAVKWFNTGPDSAPISRDQLQGKVTLVYFWTYSCINCIRTLPYLRAWADKYKDQGLTVIGVHTPEFAFEKSPENVRRAIGDFKIGFPVAVDSDFRIWHAFNNNYWPAAYFVDARGNIRHHQFGEGDYANSERVIQTLLAEAGRPSASRDVVVPDAQGAQASPDLRHMRSGETYIGYGQASNFVSPGGIRQDASHAYTVGALQLNEWGLKGRWAVGAEQATLDRADGSIVYRFHARDLHLVLGPAADGRAVRFVVKIDGKPPGDSHGTDTDAAGNGAVTQTRLYQLVRQAGTVGEHTFEIRFLDAGAHAYAFTFG